MKLLIETVPLFAIILLLYSALYFLLAGTAYWIFYGRKSAAIQKLRIQAIYPTKKSIRREIRWSLLTILVVSILTQLTVVMVQQGWTRMYYTIASHGWLYFAVSIAAGILLNDTWFYWAHRFMHLKKVFPYVHRIHHLSKTPTPWAIYSFSPAEAFLHFLIFPLLIFAIPMHPYAIVTVLLYNIVLNTTGHLGFEIVPQRLHRFWIVRLNTTVTHHEMHHAKVKYNFGLYFNFWDWLMKTAYPDNEKIYHTKKTGI